MSESSPPANEKLYRIHRIFRMVLSCSSCASCNKLITTEYTTNHPYLSVR